MTKYYVWRRNDGHLSSTTIKPQNWVTQSGQEITFDILIETNDWPVARDRILEERERVLSHSTGAKRQ